MKSKLLLIIVLMGCILALGNGTAFAQAADHPVIKPIPGSTLIEDYSVHKDYSTLDLWVTVDGEATSKTVKGEYWELQYEFLDASGDRDYNISAAETIENYKNEARDKGGTILYEIEGTLCFSLPTAVGDTYWVYVYAEDGFYILYFVKEEGLKQKLHFGVDEIKAELDKSGHIAIYGINFDTAKADLLPGAETQLVELVKLMKNNPSLKIEIQGHTDNVGDDASNQTLSEKRAQTVKSFILLYGIADNRMQLKGYGETKPVATNDTDEGRAMNRRVEIVKI